MIAMELPEAVINKSDSELFLSKYADQLRYVDNQVILNDQTMVTEEQIISLSDTSKTKKNLLSIKPQLKIRIKK